MSIDSTWLRCPNCFSDLSPVGDRVFGCDHGHRFDRSKYGFLTLLPPKAPRTVGDDRDMLAARAALLGSGAYAPIADEVVRSIASCVARSDGERLRVADLGCGTGYYAERVAAATGDVDLLLADRSPDAVRAALRALPESTGVVLDIWRPLPLRDAGADVILDIFAPRNPGEFARVLRTHGTLVVVVPRATHLAELRAAGMLLDIPPEKSVTVSEQLAVAGIERRTARSVEYTLSADRATRALLAGMGPSAHHATSPADDHAEAVEVTVSVDVLTFGHAGSAG
ncbi:methyltransferase domain-containing protein [Agromyces aurantiacus]|uniref:Methyltransferase domain-containing protein n=1 Tax=Agromyces aurantiacus TaxID=165814 RepID=A0ABV9R885_9MICO|nr:methyltransferase domain-containing protein [Agromyces aurantiacus]MBM7504735.1 23S rRNA (guanine745-N1)-methyltransferase [Agromyces aurantiacus]